MGTYCVSCVGMTQTMLLCLYLDNGGILCRYGTQYATLVVLL